MSPLLLVLLVCSVIVAFAYLLYALKGWFHQDDFIFIGEFSKGLRPSDLVSFDGFGRFLSQNMYWYFGLDALGRTSELFYFVNLMTILGSTTVLYLLGCRVLRPSLAAVVAFIYFASPRVVHAYAWISNSQHLIAHLLCFVFLLLLLSEDRADIGTGRLAALLAIFGLALISNSFSLALMAPILWQFVDKDRRQSKAYRTFVIIALVMSVFMFIRSRNSATGAYEVNISFAVLQSNADAYWGDMIWFWLWLFTSCASAIVFARVNRKVESTMFICSIAFFIPFAFLTQQRYPQYGVMTLVFFLAGAWMVVMAHLPPRSRCAEVLVSALVVVFAFVQGMQEFSARLDDPLGVRAQEVVDFVRDDLKAQDPTVSKICFEHDPVLDQEGNETGLPPAWWWWVGHGLAFSLFADGSKTYQLAEVEVDCDRTYFVAEDVMFVVG